MIKLVITRFLCTLFYIVVESNSEKNVQLRSAVRIYWAKQSGQSMWLR